MAGPASQRASEPNQSLAAWGTFPLAEVRLRQQQVPCSTLPIGVPCQPALPSPPRPSPAQPSPTFQMGSSASCTNSGFMRPCWPALMRMMRLVLGW